MIATINNDPVSPEEYLAKLQSLDSWKLVMQHAAVQGRMNSLGYLLKHGVTEEQVLVMMQSLKAQSSAIRDEHALRGEDPLFKEDQTLFN